LLHRDTTSGTHWDNTIGANISGAAVESAWNNYINALRVYAYPPIFILITDAVKQGYVSFQKQRVEVF
jgi:hypothetical protein